MPTIVTHGTFPEAIADSGSLAKRLALLLRAVISDVYPDVTEVPWAKQQVVGYGIGPRKMTEHFCYIGAHRNHVNLGFNYGTRLPDPKHLLEGSGENFRHVKVRTPEDCGRAALRALLEAAIQEREQALDRTR